MPIAQTLIMELEQEAKTTRNVLARIPNDKLAWKPHIKSMSLGGLAGHIATIPGGMAKIASLESFDVSGFKPPAEPASAAPTRPRSKSVATPCRRPVATSTWRGRAL